MDAINTANGINSGHSYRDAAKTGYASKDETNSFKSILDGMSQDIQDERGSVASFDSDLMFLDDYGTSPREQKLAKRQEGKYTRQAFNKS